MSTPKRDDDMALTDSELHTPQRREKDTDACLAVGGVQKTGVDADMASIMGQRLFYAALSIWNSSSSCDGDDESELSDPPSSAKLDDFAGELGFASEDEDILHTRPSSSAFVKQQRLKQEETLTPHPTSSTKVTATLRIAKPDGSGDFVQVDEIPEVRGAPASGTNLEKEDLYFWPPVLERKMLGKKVGATAWFLDTTTTNTNITYTHTLPTSATQPFTPTLILRAFSKTNNASIKAYLNTSLLTSLDPNPYTWATKYAKWIQQIHSRNDPSWKKTLTRDFWNEAEKAELLACVQDFVQEFGLKALRKRTGVKGAMKDSVFADWADRISGVSGNVNGNGRSKDAVRSAVFKASVSKNRGVFEILQRAERVRRGSASGAAGADIEDGEDGIRDGDRDGYGERKDEEKDIQMQMQDLSNQNGEQRISTKLMKSPATGKKRKRPAPAPAIDEEVERDDADAEDQTKTTMPPRKKRKMRGLAKGKGKIPVRSEGFGEKRRLVLEKARALVEDDGDDGVGGEEGGDGALAESLGFRDKTEFVLEKATALVESDGEDVGMVDD